MVVDDIQAAVREYLIREVVRGVKPEELTPETRLISGGLVDSLSTLNLVQFLEERYSIQFEAHEVSVDNLDTTADIARLVAEKSAAGGGPARTS